ATQNRKKSRANARKKIFLLALDLFLQFGNRTSAEGQAIGGKQALKLWLHQTQPVRVWLALGLGL
ncbi:MAG: hypothetical protein ACRDCY_18330, partial [Aeromonas veronii]